MADTYQHKVRSANVRDVEALELALNDTPVDRLAFVTPPDEDGNIVVILERENG